MFGMGVYKKAWLIQVRHLQSEPRKHMQSRSERGLNRVAWGEVLD